MKTRLSHLEYSQASNRIARKFLSGFFDRLSYRYAPILLVVLPLLLLLPGLNGFPYPPGNGAYSDLAISHYPYAVFLQRTLLTSQVLPLWSPSILSGQPLAANPLAGMWYPPGWLALLLPLPLGLNLVAALHLGWGGLGMYRLLRLEGVGQHGAVFGGIAFALLPKLYAHYGAGHLSLLYAVTWTPWLLSCTWVRKTTDDLVGFRFNFRTNWNLKPGIVLALIFLADPRWSVYAGLLWFGYQFIQNRSIAKKASLLPFHIQDILLNLALAACLAAPLALPLWELTRLSTRAELSSADILNFSLPPARLLGLVFPAMGGFHEWMLYPGALVFLLALLALVAFEPRLGVVQKDEANFLARQHPSFRVIFWASAVILSALLSLGAFLPPLQALFTLPIFNLLRVPSRLLFVTGLALVALGAGSIEQLLNGIRTSSARRLGLLLAALASFTVFLNLGIWMIAGKIPLNFAWGSLAFVLGSLWIGLGLGKHLSPRAWITGLCVLCVLDLLIVDRTLFTIRPAEQILAEAHQVVEYLKTQPGIFRVYSPSYSLPQQSAAQAGLELSDGVDPLQLKAYTDYMDQATGIPRSGYSVTLPPFSNGDPSGDNAAYMPDAQALGLLNIRFLAAEYDLDSPNLLLRRQFGHTRVYENLQVMPRAWLQPIDAEPGTYISPVSEILRTPNRIEIEAQVAGSAPRWLILSEVLYPGWTATVDGREVAIQPVGGVLRGIRLVPGTHRVVFVFRPLSLVLGLAMGVVGLLLLLFTWVRSYCDQRVYRPHPVN